MSPSTISLVRWFLAAVLLGCLLVALAKAQEPDDPCGDPYSDACYIAVHRMNYDVCYWLTPWSPAWFFWNCHTSNVMVVTVAYPVGSSVVLVPVVFTLQPKQ